MRIYIAGPYSGKEEEIKKNVEKALEAGREIVKKGHNVFIPHLFHFIGSNPHAVLTWEEWHVRFLDWLCSCDALYFIGNSRGANDELNHAKELGIKIYYSLEEIPQGEKEVFK